MTIRPKDSERKGTREFKAAASVFLEEGASDLKRQRIWNGFVHVESRGRPEDPVEVMSFPRALACHSLRDEELSHRVLSVAVASGVDLNARFQSSALGAIVHATVLHYGIQSGSAEFVAHLLRAGADPLAVRQQARTEESPSWVTDVEGETAIETAKRYGGAMEQILASWQSRTLVDEILAASTPRAPAPGARE